MRTTEVLFGIFAGTAGIIFAVLSILGILPYTQQPSDAYKYVCIGANVIGILGALLVLKNHMAGSIVMTVVMIILMIFGFPWQTPSAVAFIISIVLAMVPVKTHIDTNKGGEHA